MRESTSNKSKCQCPTSEARRRYHRVFLSPRSHAACLLLALSFHISVQLEQTRSSTSLPVVRLTSSGKTSSARLHDPQCPRSVCKMLVSDRCDGTRGCAWMHSIFLASLLHVTRSDAQFPWIYVNLCGQILERLKWANDTLDHVKNSAHVITPCADCLLPCFCEPNCYHGRCRSAP